MRILHVSEVSHGGVVTLIKSYVEAQLAVGHDVHVLAPPSLETPPGSTTHAWTPHRRQITSLVGAARTLRDVVSWVCPDVIHLHSFVPGLLGRVRQLHPAVVYQPHCYAFQAVPRPLEPLITLVERHGSRHTSMVITNCNDERDEGVAHGLRVPVSVVGLPLNTGHFQPRKESPHAAKARVGLEDRGVVVSVGRLSRQKGQARLAAAWEQAPPPDAVYVIVGPGDPGRIAAAAPTAYGSTIHCVGSQEDIRPWLWAADVLVQPSLYEGQSVAMAEALACGVPIVMTDVNGAREAIAPDGQAPAGAIVPVGDMARALHEVCLRLRDPGLARAEGETGRRRAECLFDDDSVMPLVEAVYQSALSASRARPL